MVSEAILPEPAEKSARRIAAECRQAEVLPHRHFQNHALALAVLGNQGESGPDGLLGRGRTHLASRHPHHTAHRRGDAKQRLQHFRAPGADESRHADNFAGMHAEAQRVPRMCRRAQTIHFQEYRTRRQRLMGVELGQVPSDHEADHRRVMDLRARQFTGILPIPEHQHAVRQFLHLAQPVRDVHHGNAPRAKIADDPKEVDGLAAGQAGRGLVEDQHPGVHGQRLGDLHQLLLPETESSHGRGGIQLQAHGRQMNPGLRVMSALIDEAMPQAFTSEEDVVREIQIVGEVQLLVNEGDAEPLGRLHRRKFHRDALNVNAPGVRLLNAGQDLHQRALAGAILTDDRQHLASVDRHAHALERADARIRLGQSRGLQQGHRHRRTPLTSHRFLP